MSRPAGDAGWLHGHIPSGEAQAIAEDFTNLMRHFGADAVHAWLRRYAPDSAWHVDADDGTAGEMRVTTRGMLAVLEGVALELGFGGDAPEPQPQPH